MRILFLLIFFSITNSIFSQEKNNPVHIFPNPASNYLNLRLLEDQYIEDFEISVYSLIGNKMNLKYEKISDNEVQLNIENYKIGYYFILLDSRKDDKRRIYKFSKN